MKPSGFWDRWELNGFQFLMLARFYYQGCNPSQLLNSGNKDLS